MRELQLDAFGLERFVPSPSWILKAWETTEDEILALGGLDAVVLVRIVVFRWLDFAQNLQILEILNSSFLYWVAIPLIYLLGEFLEHCMC